MVHEILGGRKALSAVICAKISRLLGSTQEFWMRLQAPYDLKKAAGDRGVMERVAIQAGLLASPRTPRMGWG